MEPTEAIKAAKKYVSDIFADEGVFNVGLEEIELDDNDIWHVTIGFSRRWDRAPRSPFSVSLEGQDDRATNRSYKVVEVENGSGEVKAVRNRVGLA